MPYKRFRKRVAKKRKTVPRMSFDKRVLSVVNKQRELKVTTLNGQYPILGDITSASAAFVMPSVFQQGQGTASAGGEMTRDGNQINVKKVILRGWITMKQPVDAALSRVIVRHLILRQRNAAGSSIIDPAQAPTFKATSLLEQSKSFTGDIVSLQTPVNKAAFVARMDKRHYLSSPTLNQAQLDIDGDQINSFKMFQKTLTFGKGKRITYGNEDDVWGNNFPYFQALGASTVDGIPIEGGLTYNYTATVYYHDS